MSIGRINPFVRYSRDREERIANRECIAYDQRIFCSLSDNGVIRVGGKDYSLKKGSVIFWKAGIPYCDVTEKGNVSYTGCNFDFFRRDSYPSQPVGYAYAEKYDHDNIIEKSNEVDLSFFPDVIYIPFCNLYYKFKEINDEFVAKELFFDVRCSALLKDILTYIFRIYNVGDTYKAKKDSDEILMYIRDNYREDLTNEAIAEKFSYHPNYIGNIVKKRTGVTLHKYLINYRMSSAIGLLSSQQYTVSEVAEMVGYDDVTHFSKSFKRVTGFSPSKYIKG